MGPPFFFVESQGRVTSPFGNRTALAKTILGDCLGFFYGRPKSLEAQFLKEWQQPKADASTSRQPCWPPALNVELKLCQPRIEPARADQRIVATFLDDPAVIHHDDAISGADGREAVGDDDGGSVGH